MEAAIKGVCSQKVKTAQAMHVLVHSQRSCDQQPGNKQASQDTNRYLVWEQSDLQVFARTAHYM